MKYTENSNDIDDYVEHEQEFYDELFPDHHFRFTICIPSDELDEAVTDLTETVIINTRTCPCYEDSNPPQIVKVFGAPITNRVALRALYESDISLECNHRFIEGFHQTNGSLCLMAGS